MNPIASASLLLVVLALCVCAGLYLHHRLQLERKQHEVSTLGMLAPLLQEVVRAAMTSREKRSNDTPLLIRGPHPGDPTLAISQLREVTPLFCQATGKLLQLQLTFAAPNASDGVVFTYTGTLAWRMMTWLESHTLPLPFMHDEPAMASSVSHEALEQAFQQMRENLRHETQEPIVTPPPAPNAPVYPQSDEPEAGIPMPSFAPGPVPVAPSSLDNLEEESEPSEPTEANEPQPAKPSRSKRKPRSKSSSDA